MAEARLVVETGFFRNSDPNLSPRALHLYLNALAYSAEWGTDELCRGHLNYAARNKRILPFIQELLDCGLLIDLGDDEYRLVTHQAITVRVTFERSPLPPGRRESIFRRDGRVCKKCGATENLSIDHIVPLSKGGTHLAQNLQVLCRSCNSRKGQRIEA